MTERTTFNTYEKNGLKFIGIENDTVRTVFIPEIGGKMVELTHKKTGNQFLLKPADGVTYKKAEYGANFEKYDLSGFDECFPTVSEAVLDNGGQELTFPDHGELWSQPWEYEIEGSRLLLSVDGLNLNCRLVKRIKLLNDGLMIDYFLENLSDESFDYLWSAHPLLKATPGSEVILDKEIDQVLVNWASDDSIGVLGDTVSWPVVQKNGESLDFSKVHDKKAGTTAKFFTGKLTSGVAGFYREDIDETLMYRFDPQKVPYLGLWLCYGGWPDWTDDKHLTVALEPTNGRPDSLKEAVKRDECASLGPNQSTCWSLELSFIKGKGDPRKEIR